MVASQVDLTGKPRSMEVLNEGVNAGEIVGDIGVSTNSGGCCVERTCVQVVTWTDGETPQLDAIRYGHIDRISLYIVLDLVYFYLIFLGKFCNHLQNNVSITFVSLACYCTLVHANNNCLKFC